MDEARRVVILDELDLWRAEGILDEDEHVMMRSRYVPAPDAALHTPLTPTRAPPSTAAYATHLVGGLLLGASLIALVQFFVPIGIWQPFSALGVGALCAAAAWVAETRRGELAAEAGFAAALLAGASVPFYALSMPLAGLLACGLALFVAVIRRGRTALAVLASVTFFVGAQHAARVDMLAPRPGASEGLYLLALVAFGALLLWHRREAWGGRALSVHAIGIVLATFPFLDALGVTDPGLAALGVGIVLGALFALALRLHVRVMVATTCAMLTLAAVSFAFLALGPALAAIVLLLLGAALVWQAETVKGYFAPSVAAT